MLKKILLSVLIASYLFMSIIPPVQAGAFDRVGPWYDQGPKQWYMRVYDDQTTPVTEIYGERYTAAQVQWVVYSLMSIPFHLFGAREFMVCWWSEGASCNAAAAKFIETVGDLSDITYESKVEGAPLLARVFSPNRPISAINYFHTRASHLNLVPEVQAQSAGFGYDALSVVRDLWLASRNIAYAALILATVVLAFLIMFRVKLNPQTAITIQSALPKVVFALIAITFSYAIAGLLIDLMYVVIGFVSLGLSSSGLFGSRGAERIFELMTAGPDMLGVKTGIFGFMFRYIIAFIFESIVFALASDSIFVSTGMSLFAIFFILALIIILIIQFFKIVFMLFKAMAQILLLTIVGPIQMLIGTVAPNMGFGAWLKSMVTNLAVFPTTGLMLVLSNLFLKEAIQYSGSQIIDVGLIPIVGDIVNAVNPGESWPPLLGGGDQDSAIALIYIGVSFVLITTTSKANEIIQGLVTGRAFAFGTGVGEAMKPAGTVGASGLQYYSSSQQAQYDASLKMGTVSHDQQRTKNVLDIFRRTGIIK